MLGSGIYKKTKHPHVSALVTQQLAWGFFLLLEEERKGKITTEGGRRQMNSAAESNLLPTRTNVEADQGARTLKELRQQVRKNQTQAVEP